MSDSNINVSANKVIILNGRRLTEAEFKNEKARIESDTQGIQLVEVSQGVWKTRLLD